MFFVCFLFFWKCRLVFESAGCARPAPTSLVTTLVTSSTRQVEWTWYEVKLFIFMDFWWCLCETFGPNPIFILYLVIKLWILCCCFSYVFLYFLLPIFACISISHLLTLAAIKHIMSHFWCVLCFFRQLLSGSNCTQIK